MIMYWNAVLGAENRLRSRINRERLENEKRSEKRLESWMKVRMDTRN
jgi:hypothetical protein